MLKKGKNLLIFNLLIPSQKKKKKSAKKLKIDIKISSFKFIALLSVIIFILFYFFGYFPISFPSFSMRKKKLKPP